MGEVEMRKDLSRREFLKWGGNTLVGLSLLGIFGITGCKDLKLDSQEPENPPENPTRGPVVFVTDDMLREAKEKVAGKLEPFYTAWKNTEIRAIHSLNKVYVPYQGTKYLDYFHTGRAHGYIARDNALVYALTGEEQFAEKTRQMLLDWANNAKTNTNPAGENPNGQGLVVARVMTIFCYAYSLIYNYLDEIDRTAIEEWIANMAPLCRKEMELWHSKDYFGKQYFNNHVGASNMGILVMGYTLRDQQLIRYAMDSPENPRNAMKLIDGVIIMPGDDLWFNDKSYSGWPAAQAGEIYDRYRVVQGHGMHYSLFHLRVITLMAEIAYNNQGVDLYKYTGPNGENIEKAFEFYADFFITGKTSIKGGYYQKEKVHLEDMPMYEIAHRRYPHNEKIKEVLEAQYRVQQDVQILGWTALLTHGLNDVKSLLSVPELGITAWDFNKDGDLEDWSMRKDITGEVSGGSLNLTITGKDPGILSPDGLGIDAGKYKYVKIRMKNSTDDTGAQIFFITDTDTTYTSSKMVGFRTVQNDADYTEYAADMSSNPHWKGKIKQLRYDPVNRVNSGTSHIDYFRLSETHKG
jgi:hypothetical protein